MASNLIKTAAHARGGVPKCPCGNESRWAMEPADKITGISIGAASCVNSIKITFDIDGTTRVTPRYGGPGVAKSIIALIASQFSLMQDEYLTSVSGYVKHDCSEFPCVSQLTFTTNLAKTYGPYGGGGGTFFEVNVEYDEIKGFFGHATEEYLTAFGFTLMQDEYLTSVSGYVKYDCSEFPCVSQLTFTTNLGKTYGPYGGGGGTFFEVNVEYDEIKGFFGQATTEYLTAFGVYVMLA
ncbi:unnamed protein product [Musa acuminata subsp. malaccensis]|nr:unnamed protein product [Musa acuminata subsp. malaccensis]